MSDAEMRVRVPCFIDTARTVGTTVEIAHDKSWASLTVHTDRKDLMYEFHGTPKQLRALANAILEGCRVKAQA